MVTAIRLLLSSFVPIQLIYVKAMLECVSYIGKAIQIIGPKYK